MNRLTIIGNGFDLAHTLPTKYSDFLKWYWSKLNLLQRNTYGIYTYADKFLELQLFSPINNCDSYVKLQEYLNYYSNNLKQGENYIFLNGFFLELSDNSLINWVDIEMFYKQKLKNCFSNVDSRQKEIMKLNKEFADVRELFQKYLQEAIFPIESKMEKIPGMQKIFDQWDESINFSSLFKTHTPQHLKKDVSFTKSTIGDRKFKVSQHQVLCFNYTNTIFNYIPKSSSSKINFIHGHYQQEEHPIIFGYGDESDELFPLLEEENKNEYLEFTKSVNYLKTINYNNLMNFIDSDDFVVEIMGHSLSISDRTLLKTIFENERCQYIFMYYHQREDGSDDFFDKSANISRHFSDKKMMRKKVAPQVFCCQLPQVKRDK